MSQKCSRCGDNEQLPTGTLCMDCVKDDIAEHDRMTDYKEESEP